MRQRGHRVVFDLARAGIGAEVNIGRRQLRRRGRRAGHRDAALVAQDDAVNAEVASRLEIVLVAELVEVVVAADDAVIANGASAEEVRALRQIFFIVALLGGAGRSAKRRRPHPVAV